MANEASITINQEDVKSLAAALWNPQQHEIFIDNQKVGVLEAETPPSTSSESQTL